MSDPAIRPPTEPVADRARSAVRGPIPGGSHVALVTPFTADDRVDETALARLVEWQIAQGTNGLVPSGTTGESPTLTHDEHRRVVAVVVEAAAGRVPVIAGTGSNSTAEAIELTRHAKRAGADAALVVTPYYNKPSQEGLFLHFTAIADAAELPILIYNIPGRCVIDMHVATMARLAGHRNIVGVKDATANLMRPLHVAAACGPDFAQFSGEDHSALAHLASGGTGCISVTANVAPALCGAMHAAWRGGRIADAMAIQSRLLPLHDALFAETNPVPVKWAMQVLGLGDGRCRLPLAPAEPGTCRALEAAIAGLDLPRVA